MNKLNRIIQDRDKYKAFKYEISLNQLQTI